MVLVVLLYDSFQTEFRCIWRIIYVMCENEDLEQQQQIILEQQPS